MIEHPAILLVDDEADLCEAVAAYLLRQGFDVRSAPDARTARALLAERAADVVVLDIAMPGEDGLSLARSLRAGGDVGILMLTAAAEVVDRIVGLEIGADDYLAKPFDLRELLARLRAILRRRAMLTPDPPAPTEAPLAPPIRMGRNLLWLERRRLTGADGQEIALVASEFELLRAFAERPNRVLSRELLLDVAHPHGEEPLDRSIDVRISRLRRKIEAVPDRPSVIRTIRGVGYLFDPDAEA